MNTPLAHRPHRSRGWLAAAVLGVQFSLTVLGAACGSAAQSTPGATSGAAAGTRSQQAPLQGQVVASYAASPPPIQGPGSAWKTTPTAGDQAGDVLRGDWPGAKAASFTLYAMWDDKNLYLGAQVVQDHPYSNTYSGGDIWKGDAFWVFLTQNLGDTQNYKKLTFTQSADGLAVNDWTNDGSPLGGAQIKLVPNGNTYWAAAAIPWSALGVQPKAGAKLGINAGTGFSGSGFIDLNGKDPDSDTADHAPLTLQGPSK